MAKTLTPATTGYINNGGLVQYGSNNTSDSWDVVSVSKPSSPWRLNIQGDLPDSGTTPSMSVSFFEGTIPLFSAVGTWQVQGQSSANAVKKNWKLKLKNSNTGNKLAVKIGDWLSMTSITLKAYGDERTLIRDSLTTEVWRQFHSYPDGHLAPTESYQYFDSTDLGVHTSALFSTAGFPVEVYQNGNFLGLYVLRTSADNPDYLMDETNNQHLLIQPQHGGNVWGELQSLDITQFTVQSPALKGYNDQDDISKTFPDTYAACNRFIVWASNCNAGTIDIRKTYSDYVDLNSVIDYIILCELAGSFDSMTNNFMLGSWNATSTSGVWYFWPYDEDETWGLVWGNTGSQSDAKNVGWVTINDGNPAQQDPGFFRAVHKNFRPEIRARWRELRDTGFISSMNINKIIKNQADMINPDMMVQDIAVWPLNIGTGSPSDIQLPNKWSVSYIQNYAKERIEWLDEQWGY
ncbi:CotH kinase family protein [Acetobacter persici]|uniref:CotH kinase family protein n=1 Tax=Acetobacter persici TaxID=1076596 RepID=UPI0020130BAF|nr:CotH kinase family protein [Acetobacter persici]